MATLSANQNLVTFERLSQYDGLIKTYVNTADAKSIKSISYNSSTGVVSFFKTEDGSGTAAYTVTIPDTSNFIEKVSDATANDFALLNASGEVISGGQTIASSRITGLGTAAAANIATTPIAEESTDNSLVSAAQVSAFVATEIAGLEGAMHFVGVITRQTGETDAQAIARVVTDPESGDVVVMSDNAKEYVYDGTAWREVGDESEFVKKTTTIAGVDLEDSITKTELLTALNVADGAQVNVLEGVQVNGTDLTITNKKVNLELTGDDVEYKAASGADPAVSVKDAIDDIYSQIGSGGTVDEKIAAAIGALDADVDASGTALHSGTFVVSGVTEVDGVITAVDSVEVEAAGAAAAAVAALDSATDGASVTETASDSLKLLSKVQITDGLISATETTQFAFATQAQISGLFS